MRNLAPVRLFGLRDLHDKLEKYRLKGMYAFSVDYFKICPTTDEKLIYPTVVSRPEAIDEAVEQFFKTYNMLNEVKIEVYFHGQTNPKCAFILPKEKREHIKV